jgi:hypothetical protein
MWKKTHHHPLLNEEAEEEPRCDTLLQKVMAHLIRPSDIRMYGRLNMLLDE